MDTAYNAEDSLFQVSLIVNPEIQNKRILISQWTELQDLQPIPDDIASIQENDELDLVFHSAAPSARLYLDALECCPNSPRIHIDNEGQVFCSPGEEPLALYRSDGFYDALRVDTLQLTVDVNGAKYCTFLKVVPKQLSEYEWALMRDCLENEIKGLAQDLVRRNIGIGNADSGIIPPDDLYAFLVINKNAREIIGALADIKDRPKYKLQKQYCEVEESKARDVDTETIKRYLRNGSTSNKYVVPSRKVIYDIQENRLLKMIIKTYDLKLSQFISIIQSTLDYRKQLLQKSRSPIVYEQKYIEGLEAYLDSANKLRKISNIIKSAEWFKEVQPPSDIFIPHSFAIDSRYGSLFRLYAEINKKEFSVELDPHYSYSWKKSSVMYEMWCYVCICRQLAKYFFPRNSQLESIFIKDQLFPFIKSGTKLTLENQDAIVDVVYDVTLPRKSKKAMLYRSPLYMTGNHWRPDVCINVYSKLSGWYIGTFIVECKYRNLNAFWKGTTWSSKEQIEAYHNDSASPYFFNGALQGITESRPVKKVFVFSPDVHENIEDQESHVCLLSFRPTEDNSLVENVCQKLISQIDEAITTANRFYKQMRNISIK